MPTKQERQALVFLVVVAAAAAGVRAVGVQRFEQEVTRAAGEGPPAGLAERALAAQIAAVDSARKAPRRRKGSSGSAAARPRRSASAAASKPKAERLPPPPPQPINVNTATAEELERLPRVGPALARRILEWRERHGPFSSPDDLRHVRGIGPSTVRLLDSLVTFSGGHRPLDSEGSSSSHTTAGQ